MINAITNTIKERLSDLDWVDRVAGLTVPATKYGAEGQAEFVFPISSDADVVDCVRQGKYWELVPNKSYNCCLYIEQQGPVRFDSFEKKYVWMNYLADLRIVGWVNLSKMGYTDAGKSGLFVVSIIKALLEDRGVMDVVDSDYTGAKLYIEIVGEVEKNQSIFSRYTYSQFSHFLVYPFDYFALDIRVKFLVSTNCVTPPAVEDEVCEDVSIDGD